MKKAFTKIPETPEEVNSCHHIREYVLRENLANEGIKLKGYDQNHPVHGAPIISLVFIVDKEIIGSVRLDKKYEHLTFKKTKPASPFSALPQSFKVKVLLLFLLKELKGGVVTMVSTPSTPILASAPTPFGSKWVLQTICGIKRVIVRPKSKWFVKLPHNP